MTEDERFVANIEQWVTEALDAGAADFSSLVRRLHGVDPVQIHQILSSKSSANDSTVPALLDDAHRLRECERQSYAMPVPHPLDYDWRYGATAIQTLTQAAKRFAKDDGCVGLIGAPSIVRPLLAQSQLYDLHLFDRNPLWQPGFVDIALHTLDVGIDPCPRTLIGFADLVIVDPPWYTQGYATFMWFGRQLLKQSGILAVSVLPIGTRPSAANDRVELMDTAAQHGLLFVEEHTAVLSYVTPPFERNALLAAGINAPLDEWRFADLWVFSAEEKSMVHRPSVSLRHDWHEVRFDEVRIRFDLCADAGSLMLDSLVPGDVLPSVSSRFPGRERATIWTSGNRVFACKNSAALYRLALNTPWHTERGFDTSDFNREEVSLLTPLVRIIDQELLEYGKRK